MYFGLLIAKIVPFPPLSLCHYPESAQLRPSSIVIETIYRALAGAIRTSVVQGK
jgi:hypothetical protein